MARYRLFIACSTLLLTGCISGSGLTLINVKSGTIFTGTGDRVTHTVTIKLNEKEYSGTFIYTKRPGTNPDMPDVSDGNMVAKAADGSKLTCDATFWGWSNSGNGKCSDDDDNTYDLMLTTRY